MQLEYTYKKRNLKDITRTSNSNVTVWHLVPCMLCYTREIRNSKHKVIHNWNKLKGAIPFNGHKTDICEQQTQNLISWLSFNPFKQPIWEWC